MKRSHFIIAVVAASLLASGVTAFTVAKLTQPRGHKSAYDIEFRSGGAGTHFTAWEKEGYPDLTYAAENAVRAVVNIENISEVSVRGRGEYNPFFDFFGIPQEEGRQGSTRERRSGGSGVIISPDGYIVTNNHVVENATRLRVKLNDNRMFDATLVGRDPSTDVALIKIEAKDLPTLPFGDSDELRLGEWVLAIGSPFDLQSTITAGIVSAKARNLHSIGDRMSIQSFIQTDAAVNPGNSGGALVNTRGQLVGINTALTSPTGTYAGYSFAVPVSIVQKVVVDLKEYGVVQRAMIGIGYNELTPEFVEANGEELGIEEAGGLYIGSIEPGGGAEEAGIEVGDILVEIDGVRTDNSAALLEYIAKKRPNDKVDLTIKRDGKLKHFEVVLRNMAGKAELMKKDAVLAVDALGGTFGDLSDEGAEELDVKGGVVVRSVEEGGLMSENGIRRGFVITEINGRPVHSVGDLRKITEKITRVDGVYPGPRPRYWSYPIKHKE